MQFSDPCGKVIPAFIAAREAMANVRKNAQNPHLKNNYANLEAFLGAIRPALEANKLVIVQTERVEPGHKDLILETVILHESGQYIAGELSMPVAKWDAQGKGSALTYARRYAISGMFGIAQADDDGHAAKLTANRAIKELESGEFNDPEQLKAAARQLYKQLDTTARAALEVWLNKAVADLTVKQAQGFNPAAPLKGRKKEDQTAQDDNNAEPDDNNDEPKPIEGF